MGSRLFRGTALAAMLAVGLAASGCSSSSAGSKSPAKLMPEVAAAAKSAKSVRMVGMLIHGTEKLTIDMSYSGDSVAGTLGRNGASLVLLSLNGRTYVKLNAAFLGSLKAPAIACVAICGKYLELPASTTRKLAPVLSLRELDRHLFGTNNANSLAPASCPFTPATLNGQSVLQCRHGATTINVAAQGKPYPVYFTGPQGQHIAFSDWNAVTLPAAPPASEVISLSKLGL